jgi:hypothetical protein
MQGFIWKDAGAIQARELALLVHRFVIRPEARSKKPTS